MKSLQFDIRLLTSETHPGLLQDLPGFLSSVRRIQSLYRDLYDQLIVVVHGNKKGPRISPGPLSCFRFFKTIRDKGPYGSASRRFDAELTDRDLFAIIVIICLFYNIHSFFERCKKNLQHHLQTILDSLLSNLVYMGL